MISSSSSSSSSSSIITQIQNPNSRSRTLVTFTHNISIQLNDTNYLKWKQEVTALIHGHKLQDFISPNPQIPAKFLTAEDEEQGIVNNDHVDWIQQDNLLLSWLLASLSEGILSRVGDCKHTYQIWNKIETCFTPNTRARVKQLKNQLSSLKKGNNSMSEYLLQIKGVVDSLISIGHTVSVDEHIRAILDGLPAFDPFIASTLMSKSEYSVVEIESILLTQEARIGKSVMSSGEMLANSVTTKSQSYKPYDSYNSGRGRRNSVSNNSGRNTNRGRGQAGRGRGGRGQGRAFNDPDVVCQLCGQAKHTVWGCSYRFDPTFQPQSNFSTQDRTNPGQFQAHLVTSATLNDPAWYPDSGASSHVTNDANNFITKTAYSGLKAAEKKIMELSNKINELEEKLEECYKGSSEPDGDTVPNISTLSLDEWHDLVLTRRIELPPRKFSLSVSRLSYSFRVPSRVGGHSLRQFTPLDELHEELILKDGKVVVNAGGKFDTDHWWVIKAAENNRRCMLGFYDGLEDEIYYDEDTFVGLPYNDKFVGLPFNRRVGFSSDIPFFVAEIRQYGVFFAFKYY